MEFRDLSLNRSLISDAIHSFDEKLIVEFDESKNAYTVYLNGQKKALIKFFYKGNGKTTIQANQGTNTELSESVASHVVTNCQIAVASKGTLSIKSLNKDDFELLLEYLSSECSAVIEKDEKPHSTVYTVKGTQGDKVNLTYYKNNTFMVQGCPVLLHSQIVEFLCEYLDLQKLIDAQLQLIKVDITAKQALSDLETNLPMAFGSLNDRVKAMLSPSLVLNKLDVELTDYSAFAFPALRALEGYIKSLYSSKGIVIARAGFADYLRIENYATLNDSARAQIGCDKTCTAINSCYGLYKANRHGLFHASGILESTKLITDKNEAIGLINEVLAVIEESHSIINT